MASGYVLLSIPILATPQNSSALLAFTCVALFLIAAGNGLFKGNLQAIVGQMYDNLDNENKGNPNYKSKRDVGFQTFYVFINIGGLIAPFVAPLLRGWWLRKNSLIYDSHLPALCHEYIEKGTNMAAENLNNLSSLVVKTGGTVSSDLGAYCTQYLDVFNTGVHYSFIASVAAMFISLIIFISFKKVFPNPAKKGETVVVEYTAEEKSKMAKEIKQRIYALFAVLGIVVFFWFSFHQNGESLSFFARDFVITSSIPPEIWQAVNPFFVIVLTPLIILIFGALSRRGKEISTPMKIGIGMGIAGLGYLFLAIVSYIHGYPSATEFRGLAESVSEGMKIGPWVLIGMYFFLTVAELFISPLGLSFVSKVAPKNIQGLCQGLWLAATAVGNIMLWIGPLMYNKFDIWICWTVFFGVCLISMTVMLSMVRWLERVTEDKK
jgi:POT family proton-dependent oligopeptide transporter